jgi:hypothetical protein
MRLQAGVGRDGDAYPAICVRESVATDERPGKREGTSGDPGEERQVRKKPPSKGWGRMAFPPRCGVPARQQDDMRWKGGAYGYCCKENDWRQGFG